MAATYLQSLTPAQQTNFNTLVDRLKFRGITNPFTQAAFLSVASKESEFKLKSELSYRSTPNARIRAIFGKRLASLSEDQLTTLKASDEAFFNKIYGGQGGNAANEGYKYRGRGFNDITFKGEYDKLGKELGYDLVGNPDLLNTPIVAADCLIQYFIDDFKAAPKGTLAKYNTTGLNDFKTLDDSLRAVYQANAGWGFVDADKKDKTGGFAKAQARVSGFFDYVGKFVGEHKTAVVATGSGAFFFNGGGSSISADQQKEEKTTDTNTNT